MDRPSIGASIMRRSSAFAYVAERALGLPNAFQEAVYQQEASHLRPAPRNYVYDGGMRVWCMELDPVDERYLLVGSSKSVINLYDLQALDDNDAADSLGSSAKVQHYDTGHRLPAISSVIAQRIHRDSHSTTASTSASSLTQQQRALQFGISAIDWYPVDGGLFTTSSFDGLVKVWDSNVFTVEVEFNFNCKVFAAKFSPISTTHSLIGVVTANREVRLCDMATDASIHSLLGHQEEIWSLAWSRANEFQLCTGGRNGEIRMWDIRRSGATACLLCLNHEGQADVPGRSSLYTNVKKLPSTSLAAASRSHGSKKRRRLDGGDSSTTKERSDPNMAASMSTARAHSAGVNSLAYTPDGRYVLSSGHDHRLRVWDASSGEHLFVNYEGVQSTQVARNVQMAVVQEGDAQRGTMVFHPNGKDGELTSYRVHSGDDHAGAIPLTRYTAHYKPIVSCVYRRSRPELFTGATDGLIMKWTPTPMQFDHDDTGDRDALAAARDEDNWSDDDEEEAGGGVSDQVFVPPILRQELGL